MYGIDLLFQGALMKAAFVCAGVVEVRSSQSLAEQLSKYGSGFELTTISNIPQGSGELLPKSPIIACMWFNYDKYFHEFHKF